MCNLIKMIESGLNYTFHINSDIIVGDTRYCSINKRHISRTPYRLFLGLKSILQYIFKI